jgi:hypothetical protein
LSDDYERFWSHIPARAVHPIRVPILETLRGVGEPLSAIQLVDVLDGEVSVWEAAHHLSALEALGVVEPVEEGEREKRPGENAFDVPYRLKSCNSDDGR